MHIYRSVPQLAVLKMADVFVTHGGINRVSEALVQGTPMVVIPLSQIRHLIAQPPGNRGGAEAIIRYYREYSLKGASPWDI